MGTKQHKSLLILGTWCFDWRILLIEIEYSCVIAYFGFDGEMEHVVKVRWQRRWCGGAGYKLTLTPNHVKIYLFDNWELRLSEKSHCINTDWAAQDNAQCVYPHNSSLQKFLKLKA